MSGPSAPEAGIPHASEIVDSEIPGSEAPGSTNPASGIPDSVAAAWGVRERPHKGPKPALSLPRIVDAAVRVADTEGLDAVSMGRVAAELGAATMSLYRHVSADRKSTRLNSSHVRISYAVFCLKK